MKIPTHLYTLFVYNEILLKKKDIVENILHELKFVNRSEILDALGKLINNYKESSKESAELIEFLNDCGVAYLQQFIISISNTLNDDNN